MHNLVETSVAGATVSVPDDGVDFRTAASLYPALQELTNRTRALLDFLSELTGTVALPAGLSVAGSVNSHGTLTASAAFNCTGVANFTAVVVTHGGINNAGAINTDTLAAGALSASGLSALAAVSCTTLTASTAVNTFSFQAGGAAVFGGSVLFAVGATTDYIISCSGAGRIARPLVIDPPGTAISPQQSTDFLWRATSPAGVTISSVGVADGDELNLGNATTSVITIYQANGTTIVTTLPVAVGYVPGSARLKYSGSLGIWLRVT